MSATLTPPQLTITHHQFTVAEYERMVETGILTEEDRVELIRGEVLDKMTIGDRHAAAVNRLTRLISRILGDQALLAIQNPARLRDSVPEPDVAVLRFRDDFYGQGKPRPEDILLLIEVADSSLEFDRETKRSIYAEAGVSEYWIVNLAEERLEVYRQPRPDGTYGEFRALGREESVVPLAFPEQVLAVGETLGAG